MYAALSLFHIPEDLTDEQVIALFAHFDVGEVIRGFDSDAGTSLGFLMDAIGDGSNGDHLEKHTRRYLYHQAWPTGVGMTNTSGYEDLFNGGQIKFRSRNLRELTTGTIDAYPALVVTCSHSGAKIKLESDTSGETWEYTCDGTESATMITASDGTASTGTGLGIDPNGYDELLVSIDTDGSYDVLIHTICLMDAAEPG